MTRLPILLVNRDDRFLESVEHQLERRGCNLHVAGSVQDVVKLLSEHVFALGIVNTLSARFTPASLRGLYQGLRRHHPIPMVVIASPETTPALTALGLPDLHVVTAPIKHGYLLELSSRLLGIGARRPANSVVQLHFMGDERVMRMGFIEDISRHGMRVRLDKPLPEGLQEGVASFVLPSQREQNEVRVVMARVHDDDSNSYGFRFFELTAEIYERIARFVG